MAQNIERGIEEPSTSYMYPTLEETPEFREAMENRNKTVEQVLEILKKGTFLWKVRSFKKWYRRKYILDEKNGTLRYEPSHKSLCHDAAMDIEIDSIVEVRKGWKTDTFNKIEKAVEKKRSKGKRQDPAMDETTCFSVIHGRDKQSLDIVAPNQSTADLWVRGLRHLVTVIQGLKQEERFERWLKQQFLEADVDKNGCLNYEECQKLLKQLNVELPKHIVRRLFENSNTNKNARDGEQVLDPEEFVNFYMNLMSRPEVKEIYIRYTKKGEEMDANDLCNFIRSEQNLPDFPLEECHTLIETFEQSHLKESRKLSLIGFTNILMSRQFEIFNPDHDVVYQDMTQPMAHYYIASSHNTYLTGNQLSGESSVEGYIDALKRGCRCVELDCWDGPEGDPIVYHGYTLTTKILFRDVLMDAIKPYAFYVSEYPVILSLENHCSEKQQETLAKHLKDILGDLLYTEPFREGSIILPSPERLKRKIIIKAKKLTPVPKQEESDSASDGEIEMQKGNHIKGKKQVAESLSNLVNICQAVRFRDIETSLIQGKCYHITSFSESRAQDLIYEHGKEFVQLNSRQLVRIYPAGKRTDSSNYKPMPFWMAGCQIVALNYQSARRPIFLNEAKFRQNGGCGYVLKPDFMLGITNFDPNARPDDRYLKRLSLTIISGQHIPKADQNDDGEVVDPYVVVKIVGHPIDDQKLKSVCIRNNGFNPRWDHCMNFVLRMPDLAFVHFIVKDSSFTGKNTTLGMYAIPFNSISQGYRHIYLLDYTRSLVSPATLFVHISIK